MFYADTKILIKSLEFNPDLFLSFLSPYAAQVSGILKKPHVVIGDTEHADNVHKKFTYPFSDTILTPASYQNNLGEKQIRMKCFIESLYLHNDVYSPDSSILDIIGVKENEKYVILRFVSWNAFHDVNQTGLSFEEKKQLISVLSKEFKVFISSEKEIEPEFEKYQIQIPPERMHDALAFSSLFIGESGTMASESALLGVPTVYINSLPLMCYLKVEQEYGILKHFKQGHNVIKYITSLLENDNLKKEIEIKRDKMVKDFINPTPFLVWFLENWPESKNVMTDNANYQDRFK